MSRKGILFNRMRYIPERGAELTIGDKVEFAYDTGNSSVIYVLLESREFLPCRLAPSSSRYDGYGLPDVFVIRQEELRQEQQARDEELEIRVKMHHEIQKIVDQAESKRVQKKDVKEIANSRKDERSRQI